MISDTLELCDLVDMPGISDPNMPTDTWDQSVCRTDHVIWCTHATQAWRQSEAAMWDRMRDATGGTNLLLITQFDKLRNPRDRSRVIGRVAAETAGKFSATYPVSLLDALEAGDDLDAWKESGAHAFMEHLVEILLVPPVVAEPEHDSQTADVMEPLTPDQPQVASEASVENVIEIPRNGAAKAVGEAFVQARPDRDPRGQPGHPTARASQGRQRPMRRDRNVRPPWTAGLGRWNRE